MELPIPIRNADHSRLVEKNYRGLLIGDGLREAARALAEQLGAERLARGNHNPFPFELLLADPLAQMEGRYRGLLEAPPDAMVVPLGRRDSPRQCAGRASVRLQP